MENRVKKTKNRANDKYLDKTFSSQKSRKIKKENKNKLNRASFTLTPLPKQKIEELLSPLDLPPCTPFLLSPRHQCPTCHANHQFYCVKCLLYIHPTLLPPSTHLPLSLKLLHHSSEKRTKSSALPLLFLVDKPKCELIEFPFQPGRLDNLCNDSTYFLYPAQGAPTVAQLPPSQLLTMSTVVAIDCTWFQTQPLIDQLVKQYPKAQFVKLNNYSTIFWRFNQHSSQCLSSAEAIYYFFKEYQQAIDNLQQQSKDQDNLIVEMKQNQQYSYDNLLFFFKLQYEQILLSQEQKNKKRAEAGIK